MKEFSVIMKDLLIGKVIKLPKGTSFESYSIEDKKNNHTYLKEDTIITIDEIHDGDAYEELHFLFAFVMDGKECHIDVFEHTEFEIIE